MFCSKCGSYIPNEVRLCSNCGSVINLNSTVEPNGSTTVQIQKASNEQRVVEIHYAGFWLRFSALLIDMIILFLAIVFIVIFFSFFLNLHSHNNTKYIDFVKTVSKISSLAFSWLYFAILESSEQQGTYGKRFVGIKVIDLEGNRISFWRASVRFFSKYISDILFIGYLMIPFTKRRQGLHDLISNCLIVKKDPSQSATSFLIFKK